MSLILLHAGGCRALAPLTHRKDCKSMIADLAGDSGKLQQHYTMCFQVFDLGGFSHLGVCVWPREAVSSSGTPLRHVPARIPPHPARLQHLAAGYSLNGYCSGAGRNVS